ncbi:MAG TPA: ATP-binding protein [Anaerolineae bacterium]|nr:ATP-binding protein [Anaerolineae bacterium]
MNLWQQFTLQLVRQANNPTVDLALLPLLQAQLAQNPADLPGLAQHPAWQARWVAAQKAAEVLPVEQAWPLLCQLAQDGQRNVREGAAHGLASLLSCQPQLLNQYEAILIDVEAAAKLKEAILHSAVVLWRNQTDQLHLALALLTTAASQPPVDSYRTIGSHLLAVELKKNHPEAAEKLQITWAAAENVHLQYHAARANSPGGAGGTSAQVAQGVIRQNGFPREWTTTADISISTNLLSQVIGQEKAVEIIRLAARQRRFVLMIGEAGTGKSMLASAMAQMLPAEDLEDVLALPNPRQPISPLIQRIPAGTGASRIEQTRQARQQAQTTLNFMWWLLFIGLGIAGAAFSYTQSGLIYPIITAIILLGLLWLRPRLIPAGQWITPKLLIHNPPERGAPFVDATGFHAGALLGDVRHDPFQSGGREAPPHQLVEPGAIHLAHGGVLFIDEVSTLSMESQQQLLTAIQEKQLPITGRSPGSSGSMVRTAPVPCNFVLVLAGNMEDVQKMHPALRSRIRGYGYEIVTASSMPDIPYHRAHLAQFVAQEVCKDGKIPHFFRAAVESVIAQAVKRADKPNHLSLRLRELGGLVRAAGDLAVTEGQPLVQPEHVVAALEITKSLEEQLKD